MQVTIDIPDHLAEHIESEPGNLVELLENGLRLQNWVGASLLANEVTDFLAKGPQPKEIASFRPSPAATDRASWLLARNRDSALTPSERAELDELALLDQFVTIIKAKAFKQTQTAA